MPKFILVFCSTCKSLNCGIKMRQFTQIAYRKMGEFRKKIKGKMTFCPFALLKSLIYIISRKRKIYEKYFTARSDLIFQQALCLEKDKDVLSWFIGKLFNQKVTDLIIKTPSPANR